MTLLLASQNKVTLTCIFQMAAILLFSLFASPSYMIGLEAFIFATVMRLFWGYPHERNYASLAFIKIMNFKMSSHSTAFEFTCTVCFEITMHPFCWSL